VTAPANVFFDSVRNIIPDEQARSYWKSVLRMAALCHDLGHLSFSHAAEKELLPEGYDHERLTKDIIYSAEMEEIWDAMTPPLKADHIVKLAVGPKRAEPLELSTWETVLAEIIIGDALGADRMDYLLRDSYHLGVSYGTYDHHHLVKTLRILPKEYEQSDEPALGLEAGGLESSEGLFAIHGAAVAFHRGVVCAKQLGRDHTLDLVFRADPDESSNRRIVLLVAGIIVGILKPKRSARLINEGLVPVVILRTADVLQSALRAIETIGDDRCSFLVVGIRLLCAHR